MHHSGHRKAVFHFGVGYAVAAHQRHPGLLYFVQSAPQNFLQDGDIHIPAGEADHIHRGYRPAAHRINIADGIGGGNLPETVRVVDNRRDKIDRLNNGDIIGNFVNAGIVQPVDASQHIRIWRRNKTT